MEIPAKQMRRNREKIFTEQIERISEADPVSVSRGQMRKRNRDRMRNSLPESGRVEGEDGRSRREGAGNAAESYVWSVYF